MLNATTSELGGDPAEEWSVDELAGRVGLPVRTIREYQTMGVLPAPRKRGRVGIYGPSHLRRLELIARLRARGHSLAGIGDLLGNWSAGADLGEVLGLEADQLVHIDEPGAPATIAQLQTLLPSLIPQRLDDLEATGVVERFGPEFCVPSPSLLQLAIDTLAAGIAPDDVLTLLAVIHTATSHVADHVVDQLEQLPNDADAHAVATLLARGRGLLAHGVGRLTLHRIGRRLGVDDDTDLARTLDQVAHQRSAQS